MAYGIGSILGDIDQKADAYRNNPDALAQSYQQNQQLIDLLVLQKLKTDKEAAQRDMQAKMQTPASTIKDQREQQVMGMTRNEVAQQVTPGLQALGQQMQAAQAQPQAQGIASVPAPNMQQVGMAGGGIIAFAGPKGSEVKGARSRAQEAGGTYAERQTKHLARVEKEKQRIKDQEDLVDLYMLNQEAKSRGETYTPPIGLSDIGAAIAAAQGASVPESPPYDQQPRGENTPLELGHMYGANGPIPPRREQDPTVKRENNARLRAQEAGGTYAERQAEHLVNTSEPFMHMYGANVTTPARQQIGEETTPPKYPFNYLYGANVDPSLDYLRMMEDPSIVTQQRETDSEYARRMGLIPKVNTPNTTSTPAPVSTRGLGPNYDTPYNGISSLLSTKKEETKAEAVLKVPTEAVKRAPSEAQQSYAKQLADLRVEQESKLESLIAFLKGAGGQSSFAATMMGGSDAMNAREAEVKGEIMDVLGKLEAIDMKEQEFGIDTERNDIAREANKIDAEVAREQMESVSGTAKMQDATDRAQIGAENQRAVNTALAKLKELNSVSPENKIAIIKMVNEKWADPNTEELVLAALNAGRADEGKNLLRLKDVYKPEFVGPFNAMREALINKDVSEMAESIAEGGGALGAGNPPAGYRVLGKKQ